MQDNTFFDQSFWTEELKKPLWYLKLFPLYQEALERFKDAAEEERDRLKKDFYSFIERKIINDEIALGQEIGNWDTERKPIDTIVIHHTSNQSGMTPTYLSAIELIRLYAANYVSGVQNKNPETFDNDYENSTPSEPELASAKEIIDKYPNVTILGHREVNLKTVCPSNFFLGENGWKKKLLN